MLTRSRLGGRGELRGLGTARRGSGGRGLLLRRVVGLGEDVVEARLDAGNGLGQERAPSRLLPRGSHCSLALSWARSARLLRALGVTGQSLQTEAEGRRPAAKAASNGRR